MQRKIKIVAFDIGSCRNSGNKAFVDFKNLSAIDKINFIKKHVEDICENLNESKSSPDELWAIGLQEYAITEPYSRFVSLDVLNHFKKTFQDLTKKYPNLMLNAGSIAVKRPFKGKAALEQLAIAEKNILLDKKISYSYRSHGCSALYRVSDLRQKISDELKAKGEAEGETKKAETEIYAVSNTNYVFYSGKVFKHRKMSPFDETLVTNADFFERTDCFYRPGGTKTNQPKFTISMPSAENTLTCGREICLEHGEGVLSDTPGDKPDIHFVSSATVHLSAKNLHGRYIVHFDSQLKTQLICGEEKRDPSLSVELLEYDPFNEIKKLRGPLLPFYPLELRIYNILSHAMEHSPDGPHKKIFETLRNKLLLLKKFPLATADKLFELYFEEEVKKYNPSNVNSNNDPLIIKETILRAIKSAQAIPHFQLLNSNKPAPDIAAPPRGMEKSDSPSAAPAPIENKAASISTSVCVAIEPASPLSGIAKSETPCIAALVENKGEATSITPSACVPVGPASPLSSIATSVGTSKVAAVSEVKVSVPYFNSQAPLSNRVDNLGRAYHLVKTYLKDVIAKIEAKKSDEQIQEVFYCLNDVCLSNSSYLKVEFLQNLSLKLIMSCFTHPELTKQTKRTKINLVCIAIEKKRNELISVPSSDIAYNMDYFVAYLPNYRRQFKIIDQAVVDYIAFGINLLIESVKKETSEMQATKVFEILKELTGPELYNKFIESLPSKMKATILKDSRVNRLPSSVRKALETSLNKGGELLQHSFLKLKTTEELTVAGLAPATVNANEVKSPLGSLS